MKEKEKYKYDAFISYKRKGGTAWAELLYIVLEKIVGKSVYIDRHDNRGGEDWLKSIINAIKSSINVIVPIFPGIQDVIKESDDCFLEEIRIAQGINEEREIKIIPFYVDGLSSETLESQPEFKGLPKELKTITSSSKHDLKFDADNLDAWIDGVQKALKTRDEVLEKFCYRVKVLSLHENMCVFDVDDIDLITSKVRKRQLSKDEIFDFWIENENDFLVLWFESNDGIKYNLILDSSSYTEKYNCCENEEKAIYNIQSPNRFFGNYCNIRKSEHILSISINWDSLRKVESIKKHHSTNFELEHKAIPPMVMFEGKSQWNDTQMDLFGLKNVK